MALPTPENISDSVARHAIAAWVSDMTNGNEASAYAILSRLGSRVGYIVADAAGLPRRYADYGFLASQVASGLDRGDFHDRWHVLLVHSYVRADSQHLENHASFETEADARAFFERIKADDSYTEHVGTLLLFAPYPADADPAVDYPEVAVEECKVLPLGHDTEGAMRLFRNQAAKLKDATVELKRSGRIHVRWNGGRDYVDLMSNGKYAAHAIDAIGTRILNAEAKRNTR
jgi:hypothetical protein